VAEIVEYPQRSSGMLLVIETGAGKSILLHNNVTLNDSNLKQKNQVTPVTSVRNLAIYMDADLSMRTHVFRTSADCLVVLRRIRSIWRSATQPLLQSIVVALMLSRLDYGNTVLLSGLPQQLVDKLLFRTPGHDWYLPPVVSTTISPLLQCPHWLRVAYRITCSQTSATSLSLRLPLLWLFRAPVECRATIGGWGFSAATTSVWNSLPEAVRSLTSLALFRKTLKMELFMWYYTRLTQ